MVPDQAARSALYARLTEVLGHEHASTLMQALPPFPASELATKADLTELRAALEERMDRFEERLQERMDGFESRMDGFERRMDHLDGRMDRFEERMGQYESHLHGFHADLRAQTRTFVVTVLGSNVTLAALAFAAAALI